MVLSIRDECTALKSHRPGAEAPRRECEQDTPGVHLSDGQSTPGIAERLLTIEVGTCCKNIQWAQYQYGGVVTVMRM